MMDRILDNNREDYEHLLLLVTICSFFTCKKIKKLERYKKKLKEQLHIT